MHLPRFFGNSSSLRCRLLHEDMRRKLRIVVSVLFGVLTLLVVMMWVRSYWKWDALQVTLSYHRAGVASFRGTLGIGIGAVRPIRIQHLPN